MAVEVGDGVVDFIDEDGFEGALVPLALAVGADEIGVDVAVSGFGVVDDEPAAALAGLARSHHASRQRRGSSAGSPPSAAHRPHRLAVSPSVPALLGVSPPPLSAHHPEASPIAPQGPQIIPAADSPGQQPADNHKIQHRPARQHQGPQ